MPGGKGEVARLAAATLAIAAFALPQAAQADTIDDAKSIDLAVYGRIVERCTMGNLGSVDFGDLTRAHLEVTARVQFDCNVPFNLVIKSRNGGLSHDRLPTGQGPYAGTVAYNLGVELPLRRPQSEVLRRSFDARALMGGQSISSNGAIAVDNMTLHVQLIPTTAEAGLLAGSYGEVLEITVSPS